MGVVQLAFLYILSKRVGLCSKSKRGLLSALGSSVTELLAVVTSYGLLHIQFCAVLCITSANKGWWGVRKGKNKRCHLKIAVFLVLLGNSADLVCIGCKLDFLIGEVCRNTMDDHSIGKSIISTGLCWSFWFGVLFW